MLEGFALAEDLADPTVAVAQQVVRDPPRSSFAFRG